MSLLSLYQSKKTALVPPSNQETYVDFVYKMQASGINDLVEMSEEDPTFRPPLNQPTYLDEIANLNTDTINTGF